MKITTKALLMLLVMRPVVNAHAGLIEISIAPLDNDIGILTIVLPA